ncbi:TetR/AcrR family transcriptional regulator [Synechocystis sp. PCC 7509]|uniref:TetR/AcrR family transcriptional regulator n=1 Tax=Synechocystis sp. PCC 7509 TaxID=927677 RepID=UPI0002AC0135|nr:TetR family transcriptional regulator [Synechocystis sp. PCC 7509]
MQVFHRPSQFEDSSRDRIKKAAIKLSAAKGFDSTTTRELAEAAGVGGDFS